jgi:hypothetical protein
VSVFDLPYDPVAFYDVEIDLALYSSPFAGKGGRRLVPATLETDPTRELGWTATVTVFKEIEAYGWGLQGLTMPAHHFTGTRHLLPGDSLTIAGHVICCMTCTQLWNLLTRGD